MGTAGGSRRRRCSTRRRKQSNKIRARAVAGQAMGIVAVVGFLIDLALKDVYWQFQLVAVTGGASFLAALAFYSARDARQGSGPDAEHEEPSPVSR